MGRRSVRENKNMYQTAREEAGMTRAQASEALEFLSESRIEKIESGRSPAQPDEVMAMASVYKKPSLCNRYCSNECPIGREYVPEVKSGNLAEIVLELLAGINSVSRTKDRLIEITADGRIDPTEVPDFADVQSELESLSRSVDALRLWVEETAAYGAIDMDLLEKYREKG